MSSKTLLVTGASGQLGRAVLEELLASHGGSRLVALTRDPRSLQAFAERGVEVRQADFDQSAAELERAFSGADRALIVSTNALDRPGHRAEQHLRAIAAAAKAGVGHFLYTSTVNAQDPSALLAGDHRLTEDALARSGVGYTVLRDNWYAHNLEGDLLHALRGGTLSLATGSGKVGYVLRRDCARAAAAALASDSVETRVLDVTGPESLSQQDLATLLSRVSGRTIRALPVSAGERSKGLESAGVPGPFAAVLVDSESAMARGWLDSAPGALELLTGRPPESIDGYLRELVARIG